MTTIPASLFVNVVPSVLAAGGSAVAANAVVLTPSNRVPIGSVYSFSSGSAVTSFFGTGSAEDVIANGATGKGSGYFGGFTNANDLPGQLMFAQYNAAAVSAYLWGGNAGTALTLAQLQALSGTLSITIDGIVKSGSVNLSTATSFTNAAEIIANGLGLAGVAIGTVTGSIGGTATTSTTTGTTLTLGALATGKFQVGDVLSATDGTHTLSTQTIVAQLTGTPGGSAGATFQMSAAATGGDLTSATVTAKGTTMTVTALGTAAAVTAGDTISGTGVTVGTYVVGQVLPLIAGEATGGVGRYTINATQVGVVISETLTLDAPAVQFDSISGSFVVYSGTTGPTSTMTFATGTISAALLLTQATGAVLSQGAAISTPAATMNSVVVATTNWVTYMNATDPDGGSGSTLKQAFAAWKAAYPNRYAYVCWDTDPNARGNVPQSTTLGQILKGNGDSGTCLISELTDLNQAAFVCGAAASIDFTEKAGRITFAFKSQAGLVSDVTTQTAAVNLGGNPQVAGDFGNGYNYYGAVGAAAASFLWFQRGTVTGPFKWFDSYVNQVVMNNDFQLALLNLQNNAFSIPYNVAGNNLIEAALADPIAKYLNFGAFAPGTISNAQAVSVNTAAGANISNTLQTQGYYLQILQASSASRAARTTPPAKFWYLDRGSVQSITLASIALQ
jgi:hypothetical protein